MAEEVVTAVPPGSREGKGSRVVLVVEDEDTVRDLICRTLRDDGYRTLVAGHGGEALSVVESQDHIDLVITDVVMPGMDGRELGRRLAQSRPNLPVLYISAYDVNDIFRRGSPNSSAPFLQKPFPHDILLTRVEQLLKQTTGR